MTGGISWNAQWLGWPVDQSYLDASGVVHADKLQGRLLMIVGEQDSNVDPASTLQVVDALIKAGKDFELLVVPGGSIASADRADRSIMSSAANSISSPDRSENRRGCRDRHRRSGSAGAQDETAVEPRSAVRRHDCGQGAGLRPPAAMYSSSTRSRVGSGTDPS
ncbi:S9 family peptidase [Sphingosinicella sp. BN140058]|uniref:alpha/beta hydrolase family protein n=1 Tax=Sphingosinicella sp. BN140058 TaxID=1892855 RepID=UPI001FB15080|nr:prolyl oligopeptidase family serine peptidase [Sphingosinicella sp. BN140058]